MQSVVAAHTNAFHNDSLFTLVNFCRMPGDFARQLLNSLRGVWIVDAREVQAHAASTRRDCDL
jgi:hypothetical protein